MPVFAYLVAVGSVLLALMFVTNATLEKGGPAIVTTQRVGLPEYSVCQSDTNPHLHTGACARHDVAARARCRTEGPA